MSPAASGMRVRQCIKVTLLPRRLKSSAGNKTIESLNSLKCARRIVITGTPLQNNLEVSWSDLTTLRRSK